MREQSWRWERRFSRAQKRAETRRRGARYDARTFTSGVWRQVILGPQLRGIVCVTGKV